MSRAPRSVTKKVISYADENSDDDFQRQPSKKRKAEATEAIKKADALQGSSDTKRDEIQTIDDAEPTPTKSDMLQVSSDPKKDDPRAVDAEAKSKKVVPPDQRPIKNLPLASPGVTKHTTKQKLSVTVEQPSTKCTTEATEALMKADVFQGSSEPKRDDLRAIDAAEPTPTKTKTKKQKMPPCKQIEKVQCDHCATDCQAKSYFVDGQDFCPSCYEGFNLQTGKLQYNGKDVVDEREKENMQTSMKAYADDDDASIQSSSASESESDDFASDSESEPSPKKKKEEKAPNVNKTTNSSFKSKPIAASVASKLPLATSSKNSLYKPNSVLQSSSSSSSKVLGKTVSKAAPFTSSSFSSSSTSVSTALALPVGEVDITKGPEVTSEAAAKRLILQYMKQQNRPYSAIQVEQNLHKRVPASTVLKVMSALAEQVDNSSGYTPLVCKEYGKAKIFYYNQAQLKSYSEYEIAQADKDIAELTSIFKALEEKCGVAQQQVERLLSQPTDCELDSVLEEVTKRTSAKRLKLSKVLGPSGVAIDPNARIKIVTEFTFYRTEWKNRKLKCTDILDQLMESSGKKLKDLMDMLGLESDEAEHVMLPAAIPLPIAR